MSAHPTECRCADCIDELQHDSDRAQAQTLALLDLLSSQRVELRRIQTTLNKTLEQLCPPGETSSDDADMDALRRFRTTTNRTIDRLCSRFAAYIGPEPAGEITPTKKQRGFARLSPEERKRIASVGGTTAQARGLAHKFTVEDNIQGGMKGGAFWRDNPGHLAEIGRKGGRAKLGYRKRPQQAEMPGQGAKEVPTND